MVYVDTMALKFITSSRASLVRVTDEHPQTTIDTVSGQIPVECIGVVGINVADTSGGWHHLELPDAHVAPSSTVELYSPQLAHCIYGARHFFDDVNEIKLRDGTRIPFALLSQLACCESRFAPLFKSFLDVLRG